jgi:hypothetical protein
MYPDGSDYSEGTGEPGSGGRHLRLPKSGSKSPVDHRPVKASDYPVDDEIEASSPEKDDSMKEKGEEETKVTKFGNLFFNVEYDKQKSALMVTVVRAVDLPAKDRNIGSSDPYVKLQLLPEKRHKVKTRVLRKTTSPVYDETFTFYGISFNQIQGITLHFVVLSFDRFSRDDIIGEVVCPLNGVDLSKNEVALNKEIQARQYKVGETFLEFYYELF